jgi:ketosteroid isomerase-like protein
MDALQRLLIQDACRELVLRSVECTDAHDATGLAALFAPDGVLRRPGGQPLVGPAAIQAAYAQRPRERITRHLVTNTLVEVESATTASARSRVLLWAGSTEDADGPQGRPLRGPQLVGEFADRFGLTGEGWRFASRDASFVLHAAG